MIQTGKKFGMQLLDDHLWQFYSEGKIAAEEMVDKGKESGEIYATRSTVSVGIVGRTELDVEEEVRRMRPTKCDPHSNQTGTDERRDGIICLR